MIRNKALWSSIIAVARVLIQVVLFLNFCLTILGRSGVVERCRRYKDSGESMNKDTNRQIEREMDKAGTD